MSERRACRVLGQPRATQRRRVVMRDDEAALIRAIIALASEYGRYGYRRMTALLRQQGWEVNPERLERIWRREGLKAPTDSPNGPGCGSTTATVSGCGPRIRTMSGPTTSCIIVPMMAGPIGC